MNDRPHTDRGAPLETLWEAPATAAPARGGALPQALARYGAALQIPLRSDRPTVLVNFVASLDGVVTLDGSHGGGGEVSGFSEPDRFVMGLLRSMADVIVIGAGTVRTAPRHVWTPGHVNRGFAAAYAAWRERLGLSEAPTTMIVTASGDVPGDHPAVVTPGVNAVIVTTAAGTRRARASLPGHVRVVEAPGESRITGAAVLEAAAAEGARVVLCEGGPHLIGALVAERAVDELFLTLAPQLLGRSGAGGRYGLVEGVALGAHQAPWATLRSIRRAMDHVFLRYAFETGPPTPSDAGAEAEGRGPADEADAH